MHDQLPSHQLGGRLTLTGDRGGYCFVTNAIDTTKKFYRLSNP